MAFRNYNDIKKFENKIWLASPTMHGEEMKFIQEAYSTNWMSTVGKNIDEIEAQAAKYIGVNYSVALGSGTAALHLAIKLAGERIYGNSNSLRGKNVFVSDTTFSASVNPILYEGGNAILIDAENETWNMDPIALERAFELYPDTKLVVLVHLYGTPGKIAELKEICERHGALIVEDAAESLGSKYLFNGEFRETGSFGDFNCISFNGNKIITGSTGGMFLTNSKEDADKIRKWSTQSREPAAWYQHNEIGYNYRMSNVIAGVIRGQWPYLQEHINQKKAIYERYKEGFKNLPVKMNPYDEKKSVPNFWLSCMIINPEAMCNQTRDALKANYVPEKNKSCPTEILETLAKFNAEGRPIWKPMHAQPMYKDSAFVCVNNNDVGMDIFARGLCLPSDNKMTEEQQNIIIELVRRCFD